MKKRKNVLIVTLVFYILAAVCAVAVFLMRPIGKPENGEDGGRTGKEIQAAADGNPAETLPVDSSAASAALTAAGLTSGLRSKPALQAASQESHSAEASQPAPDSQPMTDSQPMMGLHPESVSQPASKTQPVIIPESQAADVHTTVPVQPAAQIQPRTEAETPAPDSPLLAGEYEALYSAVSMKGAVNMRRAPDNSGTVAFSIPKGGICEVLIENVDGWMLVRYSGYTGFVYESFLEPVAANEH